MVRCTRSRGLKKTVIFEEDRRPGGGHESSSAAPFDRCSGVSSCVDPPSASR